MDKRIEVCKKPDQTWREINREKIAAYMKQWARRLRLAALAAYGNKCSCCGLDNEWFLSIDHVNNDGAEHRRRSGMKGSGDHLYRWLAKHNYPSGFQVLCYNCNLGKARNGGVCPHQLYNCGDEAKAAYDAHDVEFRPGSIPGPATTLVN